MLNLLVTFRRPQHHLSVAVTSLRSSVALQCTSLTRIHRHRKLSVSPFSTPHGSIMALHCRLGPRSPTTSTAGVRVTSSQKSSSSGSDVAVRRDRIVSQSPVSSTHGQLNRHFFIKAVAGTRTSETSHKLQLTSIPRLALMQEMKQEPRPCQRLKRNILRSRLPLLCCDMNVASKRTLR
jgi:hypothetical protein